MSKQKSHASDISSAEISRRIFLKSAASGSAVLAATAISLSAQGSATANQVAVDTNNPFDDVLRRYGSEFGDLREMK